MHQTGDDAEWGCHWNDKESGGKKMTQSRARQINNIQSPGITCI
jgi:hypothetical protein